MKAIITTLALVFLSSNQAFSAMPIVEKVHEQYTYMGSSCDICTDVIEVTSTTFLISYASCMKYEEEDFNIEVSQKPHGFDKKAFVSIKLNEGLGDCRAMPVARSYTVETKNLKEDQPFVLVNPTFMVPTSQFGFPTED